MWCPCVQINLSVMAGLSSNDAAASTYASLSQTLRDYVNSNRLPTDLGTTLPGDFPPEITVLTKTLTIGTQSTVSTLPTAPVSARQGCARGMHINVHT